MFQSKFISIHHLVLKNGENRKFEIFAEWKKKLKAHLQFKI